MNNSRPKNLREAKTIIIAEVGLIRGRVFLARGITFAAITATYLAVYIATLQGPEYMQYMYGGGF